jgi:hypothetical protein
MGNDCEKDFPKVLFIFNDPFSQEGGNGRTIGNFFSSWPSSRLAQFFINDKPSNYINCSSFLITDKEALRGIFGFKGVGHEKEFQANAFPTVSRPANKKIKKNAFTMLARNWVWESLGFRLRKYWSWVDRFQPEVVFFQVGDSPFMIDLAIKTAKHVGCPLAFFSTENYAIKDYDYLEKKKHPSLFYRIFFRLLTKQTKRLIDKSSFSIYNSADLQQAFFKFREHHGNSIVLYNSTDWEPTAYSPKSQVFRAVYFGNLQLGRFSSLLLIGESLSRIGQPFVFDVYGQGESSEDDLHLSLNPQFKLHPPVSYGDLKKIALEADLIVHAEGFSFFEKKETEFAFSTKIADCLGSGRCFLFFGPSTSVEYRFLKKNDFAYTAETEEELLFFLKQIVSSEAARSSHVPAAIKFIKQDHSKESNQLIVRQNIQEVVSSWRKHESPTN